MMKKRIDYGDALRIGENTEMDISEELREIKPGLIELVAPPTITALSVVSAGLCLSEPEVIHIAPLLIPPAAYGALNTYYVYKVKYKRYKNYKDKIGENYKLK